MADFLSREARSRFMSSIRVRDTGPELIVRARLRNAGIRNLTRGQSLPGRPDIVLRKQRAAVFVNGCFWHGHKCDHNPLPASNRNFWVRKIATNRVRDRRVSRQLRSQGWRVLTIWTCRLESDAARVQRQLSATRIGATDSRARRGV